jgi:hypothetical protein
MVSNDRKRAETNRPAVGNVLARCPDMSMTTKRFLSGAGLALALLAVTGAPAAAQSNRNDDRVCFYRDAQFQGPSWCFSPGDELADLRDRRNEISSIRISGRARVIVYDEREFAGASDEFDRDVADLTLRNLEGRRTWNDRIESFAVVAEDRGFGGFGRGIGRGRGRGNGRNDDRDVRTRVCVYENLNYQGRSRCWDADEEERNLNRTTDLNDRISSIRVFGRTAVDVYRDAEFRGQRLRIDRDIPDLGAINWGDQISSLQVR